MRSSIWLVAGVLAVAMACASNARAGGFVVPHIAGHLTDPARKINVAEKESLEALLGRLQSDTKVDVAVLIVDTGAEDLEVAGEAAFREWRIGQDWDNGVLVIVSANEARFGGARLIMRPERPALSELDAIKVTAELLAVVRASGYEAGVRLVADRIGGILRPKSMIPVVRPRGTRQPGKSIAYGLAALLVVAVSTVLTMRRRRAEPEKARRS